MVYYVLYAWNYPRDHSFILWHGLKIYPVYISNKSSEEGLLKFIQSIHKWMFGYFFSRDLNYHRVFHYFMTIPSCCLEMLDNHLISVSHLLRFRGINILMFIKILLSSLESEREWNWPPCFSYFRLYLASRWVMDNYLKFSKRFPLWLNRIAFNESQIV